MTWVLKVQVAHGHGLCASSLIFGIFVLTWAWPAVFQGNIPSQNIVWNEIDIGVKAFAASQQVREAASRSPLTHESSTRPLLQVFFRKL